MEAPLNSLLHWLGKAERHIRIDSLSRRRNSISKAKPGVELRLRCRLSYRWKPAINGPVLLKSLFHRT